MRLEAGKGDVAHGEGSAESEIALLEQGAEFTDAIGRVAQGAGVDGFAVLLVAVGEVVKMRFSFIEQGGQPASFGQGAEGGELLEDVICTAGAVLNHHIIDAGEAKWGLEAKLARFAHGGGVKKTGEHVVLRLNHGGVGGRFEQERFEPLIMPQRGVTVQDALAVVSVEGAAGGGLAQLPIALHDLSQRASGQRGLMFAVADDARVVGLVRFGAAIGVAGFKDAGDAKNDFAPVVGVEGRHGRARERDL